MITVSVDVSRAVDKFKRMEQKLISEGDVTTRKLADLGKAFAASIAPRDTGKTVQGIVRRKGKAVEWQIVAQNMHPHASRLGNFNLPYWMHNSPNAKDHIKSGDPKFMFTTRDYLEGLAGPEARRLVARVTKA